jgi:hypothetical protein
MSQIGFGFEINLPAVVNATLDKRVKAHRRTRWQALRTSLTFPAAAGYNSRRLRGRGRLSSGLYRLTLTPMSGAPRSMLFHIG